MAEKKASEKLTIEQYKERKAQRGKRRFRNEFYPWQVLLALSIPFAVLVFLILVYLLHIWGVAA